MHLQIAAEAGPWKGDATDHMKELMKGMLLSQLEEMREAAICLQRARGF